MDREPELKIIRRAFAKQVLAACGIRNPRVEAAFAAVAREDFLGPGPWQIVRWGGGYRATPDPDPVDLYTDDVMGILPQRNLNNGQPSLHAALIAAAAPQPGEHVVHVGAGVGYYTAILAELVGATGRVTAIEFDGELAARATANFAQTPHVRVVHGDGTRIVFEPVDVVYVNAERVSTGEEVGFSLGGTDGSNPSPSSSESGANLTFLPQAAEHSPSLRANSTPSPEAKPS